MRSDQLVLSPTLKLGFGVEQLSQLRMKTIGAIVLQ